MNTPDSDMMETDTSVPAAPPPPPYNSVEEFLSKARQFIDQGNPSQALQAVVMATRIQGGDEAVSQFLVRAREQYKTRIRSATSVDQLASLFAECAIAEVQPQSTSYTNTTCPPITSDAHSSSILAESGRTQIVLDAFADGSSFICLQCGGLVSNNRKDEHFAYWCSSI